MSNQDICSEMICAETEATIQVNPYDSEAFRQELTEFIKLIAAIYADATKKNAPTMVDSEK